MYCGPEAVRLLRVIRRVAGLALGAFMLLLNLERADLACAHHDDASVSAAPAHAMPNHRSAAVAHHGTRAAASQGLTRQREPFTTRGACRA